MNPQEQHQWFELRLREHHALDSYLKAESALQREQMTSPRNEALEADLASSSQLAAQNCREAKMNRCEFEASRPTAGVEKNQELENIIEEKYSQVEKQRQNAEDKQQKANYLIQDYQNHGQEFSEDFSSQRSRALKVESEEAQRQIRNCSCIDDDTKITHSFENQKTKEINNSRLNLKN